MIRRRLSPSRLALLAGASFAAIATAGATQAQCLVAGAGTLNSLQDYNWVTCTGTTIGAAIGNGNNVSTGNVVVIGNNAVLSNGQISFSHLSSNTAVEFGPGSLGDVMFIELNGINSQLVLINAQLTTSTVIIGGNGSYMTLRDNSTFTGTGVQLLGTQITVNVETDSSIYVTSGTGPAIVGDIGRQYLNIHGTVSGGTGGVAIDLGADNDMVRLGGSAYVVGDIDLGTGDNELLLIDNNAFLDDIFGATTIFVTNGANWTLGGMVAGVSHVYFGNSATLRIDQMGAFGDASTVIHLDNSGHLISNSTGVEVFEGAIAGSGHLTVAAGHLVLTQASTYSGGTEVDDGAMLTLQNIAGAGTGLITLDDDAFLRIDVDTDGVFANGLSAHIDSRVVKTGAGAVTFDNLVFGDFEVDEGTAIFTGVTTFGGVGGLQVQADGRADAFGTLVGNVLNEGVFRPGGAGVATVNLSGDYVQGATGVLEIDFSTGPVIDRLNITGTATLDGTLILRSLNNTDGSGLTFLTATGGITGAFDTIQTPNGGVSAFVVQTGNDVSTAATLVTLRPSTFNGQAAVTGQALDGFLGAMSEDAMFGVADRAVWVRAIGQADQRDAAHGSLGYEFRNTGGAFGYTQALGGGLQIGLSAAFTQGEASLESDAGGTDVSGMMGAARVVWHGDGFFAHGGLAYAQQQLESERLVDLNGVLSRIGSETDASTLAAWAGAGAYGRIGDWDQSLSGRIQVLRGEVDGYSEEGASMLRVDVDPYDANQLSVEAAWRIERQIPIEGGASYLTPRLTLGVRHDRVDERTADVAFVTSGQAATVDLDDTDRTYGVVGAGATWSIAPSVDVIADARYEAGDGDTRLQGVVGVRVAF